LLYEKLKRAGILSLINQLEFVSKNKTDRQDRQQQHQNQDTPSTNHHRYCTHTISDQMSAPTSAPKINTSALPSNLPNNSIKPLPPKIYKELTDTLVSAHAIGRLEAALTQNLSATGWTSNLRTYITTLLRSGECSSREEVLAKVMAAISQGMDQGKAETTSSKKGAANASQTESEGVAIPQEIVKDGIKLVKAELEKAINVNVDDVDD
jgi:hypothetical protein